MTAIAVYTTDSISGVTWDKFTKPEFVPAMGSYRDVWGEHCFVCSRHTDHMGEHDSLVACGLAEYDYEHGSVSYTDLAWTPLGEQIRAVYDAVIDRACSTRKVTLEVPERAARTYMASLGMELPPAP